MRRCIYLDGKSIISTTMKWCVYLIIFLFEVEAYWDYFQMQHCVQIPTDRCPFILFFNFVPIVKLFIYEFTYYVLNLFNTINFLSWAVQTTLIQLDPQAKLLHYMNA